ncbi:MAG: hypothetical protein II107_12430, partial [Prevotella sp.]|nr:hypothetical protein [Prevotella sp.]
YAILRYKNQYFLNSPIDKKQILAWLFSIHISSYFDSPKHEAVDIAVEEKVIKIKTGKTIRLQI